jgi:xylulokinase
MGVILSATASLEWIAGILGREAPALTRALGTKLRRPSPVLFLPYLSGERTPVNDTAARGIFFGLDHESGRNSLVHAVLDGVAFAFRDCLEALKAAGTSIQRATAVGGGSKSPLWLKIIATVMGIPIDVPAGGELGAAFGAARLGLLAATGEKPSAALRPPPMSSSILPETHAAEAYEAAYRRYVRLYPAWKEVMNP